MRGVTSVEHVHWERRRGERLGWGWGVVQYVYSTGDKGGEGAERAKGAASAAKSRVWVLKGSMIAMLQRKGLR